MKPRRLPSPGPGRTVNIFCPCFVCRSERAVIVAILIVAGGGVALTWWLST